MPRRGADRRRARLVLRLDLTDPFPVRRRGRRGVSAIEHALAGTHRRPHHGGSAAAPTGDRGRERTGLRRWLRDRAGVRYSNRVASRRGSARSSSNSASADAISGVSYTLPRIIGAGPGVRPHPDSAGRGCRRGLRLGIVSRLSRGRRCSTMRWGSLKPFAVKANSALESTKQVLWANLEASSLETALHVENRSQILASTSGELRDAAAAFARRPVACRRRRR